MQKSAFLLLCLSCLGHWCRAQSSSPASGDSRASLASLLLASRPMTAFKPSISLKSASTAKHQFGKRSPVTNMLFTQKLEQKAPETEIKEQPEFGLSDDDLIDAAFLLMRVLAAVVMIHHGEEKLLSVASFTKYTIDKYFGFLPGPHKFYTIATGWVQFLAPIFLSLGVFSRISGLALGATMLGALWYSAVAIGLEGFPFFELRGLSNVLPYKVAVFHNYSFETPILYLVSFFLVAAAGPGKFSIAQLLGWNDDKTLFGKLKQ